MFVIWLWCNAQGIESLEPCTKMTCKWLFFRKWRKNNLCSTLMQLFLLDNSLVFLRALQLINEVNPRLLGLANVPWTRLKYLWRSWNVTVQRLLKSVLCLFCDGLFFFYLCWCNSPGDIGYAHKVSGSHFSVMLYLYSYSDEKCSSNVSNV